MTSRTEKHTTWNCEGCGSASTTTVDSGNVPRNWLRVAIDNEWGHWGTVDLCPECTTRLTFLPVKGRYPLTAAYMEVRS